MPGTPQETLTELLKHLGFEATVTLKELPEGMMLNVDAEDSGRLIGRQGKTLSALQFIANRLIFQQDTSAPKYTVDVADYRSKAREDLVRKAKDAATKVLRWGDVVELEPLNAYERRIVYNVLKEGGEVEASSVEVEGTNKKAMILRPIAKA